MHQAWQMKISINKTLITIKTFEFELNNSNIACHMSLLRSFLRYAFRYCYCNHFCLSSYSSYTSYKQFITINLW